MEKRNNDVLLVPVIIVGGKIINFLFNALLGFYYGAGVISDAFIMAHTIPTILFDGVATALISCYIPIQRELSHESPEKIEKFNSNVTSIAVVSSLLICVLYYFFRHQFNKMYANGFDEYALGVLDRYSAIMIWSLPFIGACSIFRAHLQVANHKSLSSMTQIISYIVLIFSLVTFFPNDMSLAWATLAGNVLCFCVFLVYALKSGYRYRIFFSLKEDYIRTLFLMIVPIVFSTLVSELASIVDKFFASNYPNGIITSLTYGYQLSFALQGIVSTSLLIVVFPGLADKAAKKDFDGMNNTVYWCVELISWLVIPIVIGGIILAHPIISILFGHGSFSEQNVNTTAVVFSGYLFGVLPMCFKHVGDRVCFALKRTNLAMIATIITVGLNIILDIVMRKYWGYFGLVIATDISILVGSVTIFLLIKTESSDISVKKLLNALIRPLMSGALMGIVVYMIYCVLQKHGFWAERPILEVVLCVLSGMFSYVIIVFITYRRRIERLLKPLRRK